jgi:hypothetical protein
MGRKGKVNTPRNHQKIRAHARARAFIRSFFPSKRKRNDLKLRNRMKICALSIILLWSCSLKNATYIASHAIEVPSIVTLYHSCKSAFQIARYEKETFSNCAQTQVDQCKASLDVLAEIESERVKSAAAYNSNIITVTENVLETCSSDFHNLKSALEKWSDANSFLPLNNDVCTAEEEEALTNSVVSIHSYKSGAFLVSATYEYESKNTMDRIIDYTAERIDYDQEYIAKNAAVAREYFKDNLLQVPPLDISDKAKAIMDSVQGWASCYSMSSDASCEFLEGFASSRQIILEFNRELRVKAQDYVDKIGGAYQQRHNEVKQHYNEIVGTALAWQKLFKGEFHNKFTYIVNYIFNIYICQSFRIL